jgi:hypothetical protein
MLFDAGTENEYHGRDEDSYDAGKFQFSLVSSGWGGDDRLLRGGGHDAHSPDVIVCHSSIFGYDLPRMLRFVLGVRSRAPWIIFVLLLSTAEKNEMLEFPNEIMEHFSKYFCEIKDMFSLPDIVAVVSSKFDLLEQLMMAKRTQVFGTEVVNRRQLDAALHERSELLQGALDPKGRLLDQLDDLEFLRRGVSHPSSSPSPVTPF